ncbi:hypothetical protein B0H14DRAFT_2628683 [Mycena olivaceomarginata]|nr:hypothetical protein B0H14DRAFT_2628683 [Mycena olivaceomarginata]
MYTSVEKTHRLLEEKFGPVKQRPQITRQHNSPTVGTKIQTSQAASTHHSARRLTSVGGKIRTSEAAFTNHSTTKLTDCWNKNSDQSSSIHTSLSEKTHVLLEEKFGLVKQHRHIARQQSSPTAGRKIRGRSSSVCTSLNEKLTSWWKKNWGQSSSLHITQRENSRPVGRKVWTGQAVSTVPLFGLICRTQRDLKNFLKARRHQNINTLVLASTLYTTRGV